MVVTERTVAVLLGMVVVEALKVGSRHETRLKGAFVGWFFKPASVG